ncbi:hypothetical protein Ahy_A04g021433 [Arachis hypogaea]|uniref:RRM domain-containing protein n=1 Tax=Arachis hypogaea TaxID=3818 RepID=A0A445DKC7_ARAHY|nr:hypothetical protein Ahy_A04g021433 [Arachis hypogaea]
MTITKSRCRRLLLRLPLRALSSLSFIRVLPLPSHRRRYLDISVINNRETEKSRGFIFVTFASEQAMRDAIEDMNVSNFDGSNITVNEAQSRGGRRR